MTDTVLVVPSIREASWNRFVDEWSKIGLFDHVDVILMEDNPKKTFKGELKYTPGVLRDGGRIIHYDWTDIERIMGDKSWIIPRRSDTVRSFGYYMAYQRRDQWKYVLTLDDDCYPPTEDVDGFYYRDGAKSFLELHKEGLAGRTKWFNTLTSVKPRGIPFFNTGKLDNVVINHGLWTNVLDYDAPTQLVQPTPEKFAFDSRVVPVGQYFPMCGMNVMWRNDFTVLMYHLLMGKSIVPYETPTDKDGLSRLPFDRFGDIWCGIFAKKIADELGLSVATGTPYIHHDRASNPFANLKKEANGLEVNEKLWEYVDKFKNKNGEESPADLYYSLGIHIYNYEEFPEYIGYFKQLGQAMQEWAMLF